MPRCVQYDELSALGLKEVLADIYGDTAFPLFLLLIQEVGELEAGLAICLTEFLHAMHFLLIDSTHLVEDMPHKGTLARVDMPYNDQIQSVAASVSFAFLQHVGIVDVWIYLVEGFMIYDLFCLLFFLLLVENLNLLLLLLFLFGLLLMFLLLDHLRLRDSLHVILVVLQLLLYTRRDITHTHKNH